MIVQTMAETRITKSEMARRIGTSRTQLDRLLDPAYPSVTLAMIAKAATVIGIFFLATGKLRLQRLTPDGGTVQGLEPGRS